MKKLVAIILCFSFILAGCNNTKAKETSEPITSETETTTNETTSSISEISETSESDDDEFGECIKNGTFDAGTTDGWSTFTEGGSATLSAEDNRLKAEIKSAGSKEYAVQIYQSLGVIYKDCTYHVTFDAECTIEREIEARIQINGDDYRAYWEEHPIISQGMKTYAFDFCMNDKTDTEPRLCFNVGKPKSCTETLPEHNIYIDNISITCTDNSKAVLIKKAEVKDINLNQIGYYPTDKKIAVVRNAKSDKFEVYNADNETVAFEGDLGLNKYNIPSIENIRYADFSSLTKEGKYYVKCGEAVSFTFEIGKSIYDNISDDTLKMLYMQRCGYELTEQYAGEFAHKTCHTEEATIYGTNDKIDVSGGWHDAGDYGKYVVPGSKAVLDLLLAYYTDSSAFSGSINIPESNNGKADVLDEVKYELDWMLKMQRSDGMVYHKVSTPDFPGMIMPDEDNSMELVVYPVSYAATADFTASMAMAYMVFKDSDKTYADRCLDAATSSYNALIKDNDISSFVNPQDCTTGEYPDGQLNDELVLASSAMYFATEDDKYQQTAISHYSSSSKELGWADMSGYAQFMALMSDYDNKDKNFYNTVKSDMQAKADELASKADKDGYFITLGKNYPWGSNMTVANDAMYLIMADRLTSGEKYIDTAKGLVNYLCGTNPLSICFITGYGSSSPCHPHHRICTVKSSAIKGMLVGGPDGSLEDPYAYNALSGNPPALCYIDNKESYSTNEVTIYWNSPLIFDLYTLYR